MRAHSHACHLSISGPDLGQVLLISAIISHSVVIVRSLKTCRSSGSHFCSRFDSEPRRNVRKKKKVLTLETKIIKLLEDVDTKAMTLTELGEKYGVHKSTVSKMVKNRQQAEEA